MSGCPPDPPRTVHPRRARYLDQEIIAVDLRRDRALFYDTGETLTIAELVDRLVEHPGAIVAISGARALVEHLDECYQRDDFQWRCALVEKEYGAFTGEEPIIVEEEVFSYFGFRRPNGKERGRWFHVLDPAVFFGEDLPLKDLVAWAADVRAYCRDNDLPIRPTAAGLAGMLLRDRRFYPEPRRKVPQSTNEKARPHLPGNYYRAECILDYPYVAHYVDQQSAHHHAAADLSFPHPDDLMARGNFDTLTDEVWLAPEDPEYDAALGCPGLVYARVTIPIGRRPTFPHPLLELSPGSTLAFVFTNEIAWLAERGVKIEYLVAAWTSDEIDHGLSAYALYAIDQLETADPQRRRWLKVALLSAYGLLAVRPRKLKTVWGHGIGDEIPIGKLVGHLREARSETQSPLANVIARGMIESEVRRRSLDMAADLIAAGKEVLAIYADGILFTGTPQLVPAPWRYEARSERLYVLDEVSIISAGIGAIVKLPGRHGAARDRLLARYKEKSRHRGA